jgi:hypothetical protein
MACAFPPDIAAVVEILARARARRLTAEAALGGSSQHDRADDQTQPRAPLTAAKTRQKVRKVA